MRQLSRPGRERGAGPWPPAGEASPGRPGFYAYGPPPAAPAGRPGPGRRHRPATGLLGGRAGAAVIGSAPLPPSSPPPIGEPDKCRVPRQNSRIQTYYLANGLPSRGTATPCRPPLPHFPEMVPMPLHARPWRGSAEAPDNWRKCGS